ncbi:hypothetical protein [Riemerella anatipestifer]|nr:hypothetical protein [Riemerella anatipestifer]MDR7787008.1 hypothetical protein [Riemerella anatipestifer]
MLRSPAFDNTLTVSGQLKKNDTENTMGYKKVCLECKDSFNRPFDNGSDLMYPCLECGGQMTLFPHRFRPPKKTEDKKWETVRFLVENGFNYQHIYENVSKTINGFIKYEI